jgi:hypothetical protein
MGERRRWWYGMFINMHTVFWQKTVCVDDVL